MNYRLETIQRALETHMEFKRHVFPRFYFVSNCELLKILGDSLKSPESVRPHLKKLFANIHDVKIQVSSNDGRPDTAVSSFSHAGK